MWIGQTAACILIASLALLYPPVAECQGELEIYPMVTAAGDYSIISPNKVNATDRPYTLSLLYFMNVFTHWTFEPCIIKEAQYFVDLIMAQPNVLPDYRLELVFHKDTEPYREYEQVFKSVRAMFDFYFAKWREDGIPFVKAPFLTGPLVFGELEDYFNLLFDKTIGKTNDIAWLYWEQLTGNRFRASRHIERPPTDEIRKMAMFKFLHLQPVRRIGIIASANVSNDLYNDETLLMANGYEIVRVAMNEGYNNSFAEMKESRVKVIWIADRPGCQECEQIYCASHEAGITGPDYTLLFPWGNCFRCWSLMRSPPCSSDIAYLQLPISFFTLAPEDTRPQILPPPIKNWANINWLPFVDMKEVARIKTFPCEELQEFRNHFLAAIILLNNTEVELKKQYGFGLGNVGHKGYGLVPKTLAAVASKLGLPGTYYGPENEKFKFFSADVVQILVNKTMLKRNDVLMASPYDPKGDFKKMYTNFSDFIYELHHPVFLSGGNDGPRDWPGLSYLSSVIKHVPIPAVNEIIDVVMIIQVIFVGITVGKGYSVEVRGRHRKRAFFDYRTNLMILFGCLITDVLAIILLKAADFSIFIENTAANFRPFLVILGLSVIHGALLSRMLAFKQFAGEAPNVPSKFTKFHELQRQEALAVLDRKIRAVILVMIIGPVLLIVLWFINDGMDVEELITDSQISSNQQTTIASVCCLILYSFALSTLSFSRFIARMQHSKQILKLNDKNKVMSEDSSPGDIVFVHMGQAANESTTAP